MTAIKEQNTFEAEGTGGPIYIQDIKGLLKTAFGEQITAKLSPVVQLTAQYGIIPERIETDIILSGSATGSNGEFVVKTGTTANASAHIHSKRTAIYNAGEGAESRITARFPTGGVADSRQFVGPHSPTDGLGFAYNNEVFSILHYHHGLREVQTLTVTSGAGGSEDSTVTIDGTGYTVPLTSGSVQLNANEIAVSLSAQVPRWSFDQIDDSVIATADDSGNKTGSFAFSSATAAAAWAETTAGVEVERDWTPQAEWNGMTPEGFDPVKGNVYRMSWQYLGYGDLFLFIENSPGSYILTHTIQWVNKNERPSFRNPSLHNGWFVESTGSTTDITVAGASMALFTEGEDVQTNPAHAEDNTKTGVTATLTNILTIKNMSNFNGISNEGEIRPVKATISTDSSKGIILRVVKNATLGGTANFQYHDEGNSIALIDTAGTTVTGGDVLDSKTVGPTGEGTLNLKELAERLLPGETLTLAGAVIATPNSSITATLSWFDDI